LSLLGQDPQGYAKSCAALAGSVADSLDFSRIKAKTFLLTGAEDKVSTPELCARYATAMQGVAADAVVLPSVGHWHVLED
jgi:pimeloyl-ACP methyl ester carboxylesterase